jgi:hypothetical protein
MFVADPIYQESIGKTLISSWSVDLDREIELALQLQELNLGRTQYVFGNAELEHLDQPNSSSSSVSSELDDYVLGSLQSKILIALLLSKNGSLSSGQITKRAGISASSWAKVKIMLVETNLLNCKPRREMAEGRVIGSVEVRLTPKGVLVAQNLLLIATIIGKGAPMPELGDDRLRTVAPLPIPNVV